MDGKVYTEHDRYACGGPKHLRRLFYAALNCSLNEHPYVVLVGGVPSHCLIGRALFLN